MGGGGIVKLVPVQVAAPSGNDMLLAGGVAPGQIIVTAGVNLLRSGQKVTILGDDAVIKDDAKALAKADAKLSASAALQAASVNLINSASAVSTASANVGAEGVK